MRTILFFDLPTITSSDIKNYRIFVKLIKKFGFYMLQESVYVKLSIDLQSANSTINMIKSNVPQKGSIIIINLTEKQFSNMDILIGNNPSNILSTDERVVKL